MQQLVACSVQQVTEAMADTDVVRRYVGGALRTPLPYAPLGAATAAGGARGESNLGATQRAETARTTDYDDDPAVVRARVIAQSLKESSLPDEAEARWRQNLQAYLGMLPSPAHDPATIIANVRVTHATTPRPSMLSSWCAGCFCSHHSWSGTGSPSALAC